MSERVAAGLTTLIALLLVPEDDSPESYVGDNRSDAILDNGGAVAG